MLECVINISEGRELPVVTLIALRAETGLLDVHSDRHHNRSVLTLAGPDVEEAAFAITDAAVEELDLGRHRGVHPRLGVVDVVPFVPLPGTGASIEDAVAARNRFATRVATTLGLPCFLYGPERTLPEVRRHAFTTLAPDAGPTEPHPTAGAVCVGARPVLVAYNLRLAEPDSEPDTEAAMETAREIVASIRGPAVRALALDAGGVQVSCNLVDPGVVGPAEVYDLVAARAPVKRAELVGLLPRFVLEATPPDRWEELGLSPDQTIEARLQEAGLDGGSFS